MTDLHTPSNHKDSLRRALLHAHQHLSRPAPIPHLTFVQYFFAMTKRFWKVTLPASALTIAAITGVVWTQRPTQTDSVNTNTFSFLQAVKAAYAQEADQPDANSVHHQTIQVSYRDPLGKLFTTTEDNWSTQNKNATIATDSDGKVIDHSVSYTDDAGKQHMYQLYPVGEAIPLLTPPALPPLTETTQAQTTIAFSNEPPADSALALSDIVTDNVVCIFGNDLPLPENAETRHNIDEAAKLTDPMARRAAIEQLLANEQITDLGEQAGLHGFALKDTGIPVTTEYYFDTQSFALKRYVEKNGDQVLSQNEYLVDEYVAPEALATDPFVTTGLTEVIDEHSELFQKLDGKATGCYDADGNQVSELTYEVTHQDENSVEIKVSNPETGDIMMIGQGFGPSDLSTIPLPEAETEEVTNITGINYQADFESTSGTVSQE